MKFWVGICMIAKLPLVTVPMCVSYGQLRKRKTVPIPGAEVFLDSRGFSEIKQHGRYTFTPETYAGFARWLKGQWGDKLAHASIMDWMCEKEMLAKTGLTILEHQKRTVQSWLDLNRIAPELPWVPVLQGYSLEDYQRCAAMYAEAGVDLFGRELVGIGSVCRRQGMQEAAHIIKTLYGQGFKNLHGFGVKITGLVGKGMELARYLKSSDSMAWSMSGRIAGRQNIKKCGGVGDHKGRDCSTCWDWAVMWRNDLVRRVREVMPKKMTPVGLSLADYLAEQRRFRGFK